MAYRIKSISTLDPAEYIAYESGIITQVNSLNDTADVQTSSQTYNDVPVFYNCPEASAVQRNGALKNSSDAFCRGDEVIVRIYQGAKTHIIGFTGDLWLYIKVPAFVFAGGYLFNESEESFSPISSELFHTRYKEIQLETCSENFTTYINNDDADISEGFVSSQTHWTDSRYNRDSKFYFNGELFYQTYNNETFTGTFNGTRSNIIGSYVHPDSGWGVCIYQINTFYDWRPHISGRIKFDFFFTHQQVSIQNSPQQKQKLQVPLFQLRGHVSTPVHSTVQMTPSRERCWPDG